MDATTQPDGGTPGPEEPAGVPGAAGDHVGAPLDGEIGPSGGPGDPDEDDDRLIAHDPLRFSQWMKRSATGAVLSGIALGLQQALERKREVPAFVMEAPGEPDDPDAPITLHFDPDDPTKTVAVIRTPAPDPRRAPEA